MDITLFTATTTPILVGVIEAIKRAAAWTDTRFVPLLALALGEAAAFGARAAGAIVPSPDLFITTITGALIGLAASGLYAGGRTVADI